jgi:hypothetical protein
VNNREIIDIIKKQGRVCLQEKSGFRFELIDPGHWNAGQDDEEGIFLLFEIFQIRGIAEQFSEISLDIVEFTTKPVIFHSPANRHLKSGPVSEGNVRFWLIREGIWNSLLFSYGRPLIFQRTDKEADYAVGENFILATREMFLGPEGDVKIIAQ